VPLSLERWYDKREIFGVPPRVTWTEGQLLPPAVRRFSGSCPFDSNFAGFRVSTRR